LRHQDFCPILGNVTRLTTPVPPYVDPTTWRRFCASVVVVPDGCHLWIGPPGSDGHGHFWAYDRAWSAHRFAWFAWHGEPGDDHLVVHRCDRSMCAPVTRATADAHLRSRTITGRTAARGSGDRGHARRVGVVRASATHRRRRDAEAAHRAIQAGTLDALTVALSREAEADAPR
jgi:hypothetical protein